jgi:hypothetical protein
VNLLKLKIKKGKILREKNGGLGSEDFGTLD